MDRRESSIIIFFVCIGLCFLICIILYIIILLSVAVYKENGVVCWFFFFFFFCVILDATLGFMILQMVKPYKYSFHNCFRSDLTLVCRCERLKFILLITSIVYAFRFSLITEIMDLGFSQTFIITLKYTVLHHCKSAILAVPST